MFKLKASKVIRLIGIIATLFLVVAGTGMLMGSRYISHKLLQSNQNNAIDVALLVRNNFQITDEEVAHMKSLSFNEMEVDQVNRRLMDVGSGVALNSEVSSIYLLAPLSEDEIKYHVDKDLADFFGCEEGTALDGMWLLNGKINQEGEFVTAQRDDIYRYPVLTESQKQGMKNQTMLGEFTSDAWGTFVTGYVPIYTVEGNFVDCSESTWIQTSIRKAQETWLLW